MALHHALRDLVSRLGPGTLEDADTLLGTLDDYVEDGDADPAALDLLADAVRHGVLPRLTGLLDNGADPVTAVATAGAALAARRGSDERAARWAAAALGYAAGRIDDPVVGAAHAAWQAGLPTRHGAPLPPPPPSGVTPPAPTPAPAPVPGPPPGPPRPAPDPERTDRVRRTAVQESTGSPGDPSGPHRRRALPAVLVALLVAAAGLAGWLATRDGSPGRDDGSPDAGAPRSPATDTGADPSAAENGPGGEGSDTSTGTGTTDRAGSGGFVAYASRSSGVSRVRVLDLAGGTVRTLTTAGDAAQPSVSEDGRTVAFILETDQGKRLAVSRDEDAPLLLDVGRDPADPAISPDGSAVAYVTQTEHGEDVSIRRLAESTPLVVAGGTADEFDPVWSDDGKHLAYVLTGSSDDSIILVDADSGAERSRTVAAGHASSPALSPSGDEVAYVTRVQGNAEVVVAEIGADGAGTTNLSQSADTELAVVWLADGRLVTSAPGRGLTTITTESPEPEALTSGAGDSL